MRGLQVRRRIALVFLLMSACFGVLAGRLSFLQVIKAPWLQEKAHGQRLHQIPIDAHRGIIRDRDGGILAASYDADCIGAIPAEVRDPARTAAILAPILGMKVDDLSAALSERRSFVWLRRRATKEQAEAVKDARLPGIRVEAKAQRYYPKEIAGQVLGFAGSDNQGLEGLELFYDAVLRGRRGWDLAEFSAIGRHIPGGERYYVPPVAGDDLILTIDEGIQFIAERELDQAMAETSARRGLVLIMDPRDGGILAMASRPRMDPNDFLSFPQETWKNICLTDQFEPGSIFKVVTAAAALEESVVTPSSTFFDPGYLTVDDRHIHCWLPGGHGSQTFVEAVENSCNPVFASLALSLGPERFYRYIKAFGFGSKTGIDFPGEATGTIPKLDGLKRVELATLGFGQGLIAVTPMQMARAVAAIANGGYLIRPHLLKEIRRPDGALVKRIEPEMIRQVISGATAETMRKLMESVVLNGSGNRASVPGYRIAGKTGTAQKPSKGGGYGNEVVASFVGFAPADDPRLVGVVMLDEPQCGVTFGGVIAAPVFGRIMAAALRDLNIPARVDRLAPSDKDGLARVPNVLNFSPVEAQRELERNGLQVRSMGTGSYVIDQVPKPSALVKPGTTVLLYFDPAEKYNIADPDQVKVPDLSGLRPEAVEKILTGLGLRLIAVGDGTAGAQEPRAGLLVSPGTSVTVRFSEEKRKQ